MLLVLTHSEDATADYLCDRLEEAGVELVRLDTDTVCEGARIEGGPRDLALILGEFRLKPSSVSAVWLRRPRPLRVAIDGDDAERAHVANEWGEAIECFLARIPTEKWMNHPTVNVKASHKLEQLSRATDHRLTIPDTLITQDRRALHDFYERHGGEVVTKPLASGFLERTDGSTSSIYTNRISKEHIDMLPVEACPTMYQERVQKAFDVRLTVVDNDLVAVALKRRVAGEQILDIRRDNMEGVAYELIEVPPEVSAGLRSLLSSYQLRFAAVDFVVTDEGKWIFLEINPNGQWAWLDLVGATTLWRSFRNAFTNP